MPAGEEHHVPGVEPWSDEQPRLYDATLYDATLSGPDAEISFRIGFRRIEVTGGQLLVTSDEAVPALGEGEEKQESIAKYEPPAPAPAEGE